MECPHCGCYVRFPAQRKLSSKQVANIINDPENRTAYWAKKYRVNKTTVQRVKRKKRYINEQRRS